MWWLKNLKWPLFVVFFVFVFAVSMQLTFPNVALKNFVTTQLEDKLFAQNQTWKTPPRVRVGEASLWRLSGVDLRQLQIEEGSRDEIGSSPGTKWMIDTLQVRFGILAFSFGGYRIGVNLDAYGASASGSFDINKTTKQVDSLWIEAEDLDLSKMAGLASKIGLPLEGIASISLDFDAGANLAQDASGSLTLSVDNLGVKFGQSEKLGKLDAEFEITNGRATSKSFKIAGTDFSAEANISAKLQKDVMRSILEGKASAKPTDAFAKKAPAVTLALKNFGERQADGKYLFALAGTIGSPSVTKPSNIRNNPLRNMVPRR